MEYDKRKTRPESTWKFLIQQVQDQSSLCDVVVKMGYWEKRFHRCVLETSPFFDHVLNDNFLEEQTGKIEISFGTPVTLEIAIMFLYGQKPKFNQENIENSLHMAEFLLIPNLKSACIAWIKSDIITEENCSKYLQLSSIYDFELPICTIFIKVYLPEMLPQLLNLTKDSIQLLFSDKRLSYVPMDDKLLFLLKWSDANPDARKVHMQELLTTIDFRELSQPILEECKQNPNITDFIILESPSLVHGTSQRVLVMKDERSDGTFWCLDFERDQWFRVDSESFKKEGSYLYDKISGTCSRSSESVICFVNKIYPRCSILLLDLSVDTCSIINVVENERFKMQQIDDLKIGKDICIVSVNKQIPKKVGKSSELLDQLHSTRAMENDGCLSYVFMKTSTLFIGHIGNDKVNAEMLPLLSFKGDEIHTFFIGQNAIAIIFESRKYVAIYDLDENSLEKMEQPTQNDDELGQFKDGFVIYNRERCISFMRCNGPCLEKKYEVVEIQFEQNAFNAIKYFLRGEMMYRYFPKENDKENFNFFESVPFQTMLSRKPENLVVWKQFSLPKEAKSCYRKTMGETCFEIHFPKSKPRCHFKCPHCKMASRVDSNNCIYWDSSDDDYIYWDSSDDDYIYENAPDDDSTSEDSSDDDCTYENAPDDDCIYENAPDDDCIYENAPDDDCIYENAPDDDCIYENAPDDDCIYEDSSDDDSTYEDSSDDDCISEDSPDGDCI